MRKSETGRAPFGQWLHGIERYDHRLTAEQPIWVAEGVFQPGPGPLEVHCHKALGIGFALNSGLELVYENLTLRPRRGDVWLDAMWEPHGWRVVAPASRAVVLTFLPDIIEPPWPGAVRLLEMFAVAPAQRPAVQSADTRRTMMRIAHNIAREATDKHLGWLEMVRLHLIGALILLRREWEIPDGQPLARALRADHLAQLMPALRLANEQVHRCVSVEEAAALCGLSPWWFHRVFKDATGMTFARFALRARLGYAAHLLLSTDMSVCEVGLAAGFSDGSHFHRRFSESYGCTPGQYRQRHGSRGQG